MSRNDDEILPRLVAIFQGEAEEHIQVMATGLTDLANAPSGVAQTGLIESVFREAHSLKGAARAVRRTEVEVVCQALEGVLAGMKRGEIAVARPLVALLVQVVDRLGQLVMTGDQLSGGPEKPALAPLIRQLESLAQTANRPTPALEVEHAPAAPATPAPAAPSRAEPPAATAPPAAAPAPERPVSEAKPIATDMIRLPAARLEALLRQAEELVAAKLAAEQHAASLAQATATLATWEKRWAKLRPAMQALAQSLEPEAGVNTAAEPDPALAQVLEFGEWNATLVTALTEALTGAARTAERDQRALGGMVDNLLQDMKQTLLMPFASVLEVFPRQVRELARESGKEVELVLLGTEIEADRRILQAVKDPLIHLVRNCIDHGLERPAERLRQHKPARGTVTIAIAHHNGGQIEIRVADDGAGIDAAQVQAAALRLGVVSPEAAKKLSPAEILALVFQSGLSTSPLITDISGRGLGLAIVWEKVERLGGTVWLESEPGAGTTFHLLLPLTLATFRGVLVRTREQRFILPTTHVERVLRVRPEDIRTLENRETLQIDGQTVALVGLAETLELPARAPTSAANGQTPVVVLAAAEKRIGFRVDEIVGEQEVLVKRLGPQLSRVRNIAAATVLATGQVVPILNVPDLMKSAVKGATAPRPRAASTAGAATQQKAILVAEDSITARTLLKSILEAAGYRVQTAVDGQDALTTLRTQTFDLVVSDVEMPRLSGLDLTAKIRADKQLAHLPVILLTALESREDRERGIEVGANAYLVKQSFDQSNLLAVVRRML